MPIYTYNCGNCEDEFRVSHSMTETQEVCEVCGSIGTLTRIPSIFSDFKIEKKQKVGDHVKDFIAKAKEELKEQKKGLKK